MLTYGPILADGRLSAWCVTALRASVGQVMNVEVVVTQFGDYNKTASQPSDGL